MATKKGFVVVPAREHSLDSEWGNPALFALEHRLSPTQLQQLLGSVRRQHWYTSWTPPPSPSITSDASILTCAESKPPRESSAVLSIDPLEPSISADTSKRARVCVSETTPLREPSVIIPSDSLPRSAIRPVEEVHSSPVNKPSSSPSYRSCPRRPAHDNRSFVSATPPNRDTNTPNESKSGENVGANFGAHTPNGLDLVIGVLQMPPEQLDDIQAHFNHHRDLIPNGADAACRALSRIVGGPVRPPRSAAWWSSRMRHLSSPPVLPKTIEEMIAHPARRMLDRKWVSQLLPKAAERVYNWRSQPGFMPANYECYVNFMDHVNSNDAQLSVLRIATLIFFFFAHSSKPETWIDTFPHRVRRRMTRMTEAQKNDIAKLYSDGNASPEKRQWFLEKLPEWRRLGSFYSWLAYKLGPGALLYLLDAFPPNRLGGFSKGRRRSAGSEAVEEMKERNLHIVAETSGANSFMHDLLWGMVQGALSKSRHGKAPFPGFEGPLPTSRIRLLEKEGQCYNSRSSSASAASGH